MAWAGIDLAIVTIDDDGDALQIIGRQIHCPHHRRDAHGPGKNRHMGVTGAAHGNHAMQLLDGDGRQHARGNLFANQYRLWRKLGLFFANALQVTQHPNTKVFYIGSALTQIRIVHHLKATDVLANNLAQCPLGPLTLANHRPNIAGEGTVIQHMEIGIEQGKFFLGQARL